VSQPYGCSVKYGSEKLEIAAGWICADAQVHPALQHEVFQYLSKQTPSVTTRLS
jgi:hypothetical protein